MMSLYEWRESMKERKRCRWEDRHFPPVTLSEMERRRRAREAHKTLRQWDNISEDELLEQGHAPADIEALRTEAGGYRRWLAHTVATAATEDYRTLVASLPKDSDREKLAQGREASHFDI
jgi:hypothetical protein